MRDLTNQSFGTIKVLHRAKAEKKGKAFWQVKCTVCDKEQTVRGDNLTASRVRCCGGKDSKAPHYGFEPEITTPQPPLSSKADAPARPRHPMCPEDYPYPDDFYHPEIVNDTMRSLLAGAWTMRHKVPVGHPADFENGRKWLLTPI